jgi:TPR repeat protein
LFALEKKADASAQHNLGVMNNKCKGVPQNKKTAVKWSRLAAEQGDALAQFNLGQMYALEQGVIKDDAFAHMWGNITASNRYESGGNLRNLVAKINDPIPT